MKLILITSMLLWVYFISEAQVQLRTYVEIGESQISEGVFSSGSLRGNYRHIDYTLEGGVEYKIKNNKPHFVSGLDLLTSKMIALRAIPLEVKAYILLNRFSTLIYESNLGFRAATDKYKHWHLELGTNFKTYTITPSASHKYNISKKNLHISENFNLIYQISGFLKPHSHHWNLGLSMTNIDYFIINQPTNPVFNVLAKYKANHKLTWHFETWYKPAGVFNISANYFGYFIRGGVLWNI